MIFKRNEYGATNFVTGMRAWAAIGVLLIHSGGGGLRNFGDLGNNIADFGSTGVYAFFVISGFSVCHSYLSSLNFQSYMWKRLARIVPIYFIFIILFGFINGSDILTIMLHLIFLSWLNPETANSILSVEWSIPVEVFWYLFIPSMLIFAMKSVWNCIILLVVSFFSYSLSYQIIDILEISPLALHWSPFRYFFVFALGVVVFSMRGKVIQKISIHVRIDENKISDFIICLTAFIFIIHLVFKIWEPIFVAGCCTALLISLVNNNSFLSRLLFSNWLIQFLGMISYSIYLWHVPIIGVLKHNGLEIGGLAIFMSALFVSSVLATITYYIIEKPSIKLGRIYPPFLAR